jgi:dTDP-4-dehydrorhamnose 3,5-epimerase-like enzyme
MSGVQQISPHPGAVTPGAGTAGGVRLMPVVPCQDARGCLLPVGFDALPFAPARMFVVRDVPAGTLRGGHAHRSARQWLLCVAGRVEVAWRPALAGDEAMQSVVLDRPDQALLIEAGVWASQRYVESGSILIVLSSEPFDEASYLDAPPPRARVSNAP